MNLSFKKSKHILTHGTRERQWYSSQNHPTTLICPEGMNCNNIKHLLTLKEVNFEVIGKSCCRCKPDANAHLKCAAQINTEIKLNVTDPLPLQQ